MAEDKLRFSTASGSRTDIHVYCHFYCHKKLAVEVAVEKMSAVEKSSSLDTHFFDINSFHKITDTYQLDLVLGRGDYAQPMINSNLATSFDLSSFRVAKF